MPKLIVKIRKMKVEDSLAVCRLHRGTLREINSKDYYREVIDYWVKGRTTKGHKESLKSCIKYVAFLEKTKTIVGFGDYQVGENLSLESNLDLPKTAELTGLYVHKNYQGIGIGKKLFERIQEDLEKQNISKLDLTATLTAGKFYEKMGFSLIKKDKYPVGKFVIDVYKMEKILVKG
jgi:putative acetyltransferase